MESVRNWAVGGRTGKLIKLRMGVEMAAKAAAKSYAYSESDKHRSPQFCAY